MSTPERGRRATDLFDERQARLTKLLARNAPRIVIAGECELILRAHHGSRFRVVSHLAAGLARHCWERYVQIPAMRWLCRTNLWHQRQDEYGYGCSFCDRNTRPDILAAEQELEVHCASSCD